MKHNYEELVALYAIELKQLETSGFTKKHKIVRLLHKTKGNLDIVLNFLQAQERLKKAKQSIEKNDISVTKEDRKKLKEERRKLKNERKILKQSQKEEPKETELLEDAMKTCKLEDTVDIKKNSKEERKQKNFEKKSLRIKEKEEKKVHKEEKKEVAYVFPSDAEYVYIDGNNLIFVLQPIRALALQRRMPDAEYALQLIAQEWIKAINIPATLIFDDTHKKLDQNGFRVCSAKPTFSTSDEALIHWASQMIPAKASKTIVFTSDRGLSEELCKYGIQVLKSKVFFKIAAPILGQQPEESLDNWATRWLADKLKK